MLPLFYVAWADRVLSPSEVRFLKKKALEFDFLTDKEREVLQGWSDPSEPPKRELFKLWEIEIRRAARRLPEDSRRSLVDLGLAMARDSTATDDEGRIWLAPATRQALEELEAQLGLIQLDTYRSIFADQEVPFLQRWEATGAPFAPADLARLLDGDYGPVRAQVQALLADPVFARHHLPLKEAHRARVLQWCQLLAERGLGALAYPAAYGGQDDMGAYGTVFETLGYHDLSLAIKFGVQFGLFGGSILWLGTKRHHDQYLAAAGRMDLPGCFAMTETGHGSNVRGLETTITYEPEEAVFIVHTPRFEAGKEYIGNALHGRMATVFGQLITKGENQGIHAVLVPLRDENGQLLPGIHIEDNGYKMGLNGVDNGRIWFDQVRVPREHLLDRFGTVAADGAYTSPIPNPSKRFFTMLGTLVGGRVMVPRAGLSAAKSGLTIAIRYALKRRQFAPDPLTPETLLLDYPSHQRRLLPLLAETYACHFALNQLMQRYLQRQEADMREIETLAAGLKAGATWFTTRALQECREACGGKGYLQENRFADLKADTDIFTTFEGDNTVLMQLVARSVLTDFRKEFSEEGMLGILRYVGSNIATDLRERNPLVIRNTDRQHLLDRQFLLGASQFRLRRLTFTAGQRLRSLIRGGTSAYDAFLQCQTHLLAVAEAYVEHFVNEQFFAAIDEIKDAAIRTSLQRLAQLHALHTIERHKGWYLEKDYLEGVKSRAIRRLIDELCAEVRPEALALVEAFAIPDFLLNAEIA